MAARWRQVRLRGIEQIPWLYDTYMTLIEAGGLGRWRRWLLDGSAGRVLDAGCGTGRNLGLFDGGARVVDADPCPADVTAPGGSISNAAGVVP